LVVAVLVLAAIVVHAALFTPAGSTSSNRHTGTTPRPTLPPGTPAEIVGWTSNAKLVVLSTATGHVLRTLATNVSILAPGLPNVSVAPDGTVFFESAAPSPSDSDVDTGDQIFSVPMTGGPVRDIATGSDPQVSPNGDFLAFISPDPAREAGEAPYLVPAVGIDIAALSSGGTVSQVRTLPPGPAQVNQGASDLSWSGGSKDLSFDLLNPSTDMTTSWTIPVAGNDSLAAARQITLRGTGLTWNGYWGSNRRGAPQGLGVLTSASGHQEVVSINPATGRPVDRLFAIPADICTATVPADPDGCTSDFSNAVIGDGTATSILVGGAIPLVEGAPTTSGKAFLYRWSVGERVAVRLTPQVLVAAWGRPDYS
jgi:outer membrane protein assembly factor BamB